ncbi:MAG: hypothetical protein ACE5G1_01355 [bacterium]
MAEPALMVLSEIYYPAGWKAYVDGDVAKIYKTNAILRSIFLKPGEHEIRFVFESGAFRLGLWLTFSAFGIIVGLLIYSYRPRGKGRSEL